MERVFEEIRNYLPTPWQAAVEICPFPSKGIFWRVRNLLAARRRAGDVNHIIGDSHYLALSLPRRGLVLTIHDCAPLKRLTGWRREVLRQLWYVLPMRRAAVVTTISEATKNELRHWVGDLADKVLVIPNCVRAEFEPDFRPFHAVAPVVLQVGTGWNKNVERVAEALRGSACRLDIVGALSEHQRQHLADVGVVFRELGRLSHGALLEAYRGCDLAIFASIYEGFGLPIIEAQAVGRPVITSDRSPMPEVAGDGGLFIDPEDVGALRSAVERLIADAEFRESVVAAGYKNAVRFQPHAIASQYAAIYRKLVEGGVDDGDGIDKA